ncbi:MAG: iron ABC transporter permease [Lachnospiraceae bacterium]|nr:iron ABC transporter permease [Lachnospiraceae bacterium]
MKKYILPTILLAGIIIFAVLAGNGAISTKDIITVINGGGSDAQRLILYKVRLPRIFAAAGCGAALSVAGFLLQGSLDNRIVSPGILGIYNGAGLFVLLSALLFPFNAGIKCLMAFAGALLVTVFVSILSVKTGMSKTSVVLSGVAVSAIITSVIDLIISIKPETVADKVAFQIGGFANTQYQIVMIAFPLIAAALLIAFVTAPSMDILKLGDEIAHGLGLGVKAYRCICVLIAAILAGTAISMGGLLGFVGLIIPNCVRMIHKEKSRGSMIFCILYGAAFLVLCDTLSRLIVFPYELPCGLLLSVVGAPFLIWILVKNKKRLGTD